MNGFADKRDYIALQNIWVMNIQAYLTERNEDARYEIVDDFKDSLVDVTPDGPMALRSKYDKWEQNIWKEMCLTYLNNWKLNNSFKAAVPDNLSKEFERIKQDNNYIRYRKIIQIIQDSGIGLGSKKTTPTIQRKGYTDGRTIR